MTALFCEFLDLLTNSVSFCQSCVDILLKNGTINPIRFYLQKALGSADKKFKLILFLEHYGLICLDFYKLIGEL